jgi:hypothetical protein
MKGYIYSHKRLIGTTNFKNSFGSMGHMYGQFTPTEDYELIKKEVQYFCENGDHPRWHALRFNVQLENGYFILPVGGYVIDDFPEEPQGLHIAGVHHHVYEDYFENNKEFLIEPWHTINIEQKIDLEDELFKELRYRILDVSALAKHRFKDEVLFTMQVKDMPSFAIANLKRGQRVTIEGVFPKENRFEEFGDFIKRMTDDTYEK